jgi:hypothetical protein
LHLLHCKCNETYIFFPVCWQFVVTINAYHPHTSHESTVLYNIRWCSWKSITNLLNAADFLMTDCLHKPEDSSDTGYCLHNTLLISHRNSVDLILQMVVTFNIQSLTSSNSCGNINFLHKYVNLFVKDHSFSSCSMTRTVLKSTRLNTHNVNLTSVVYSNCIWVTKKSTDVWHKTIVCLRIEVTMLANNLHRHKHLNNKCLAKVQLNIVSWPLTKLNMSVYPRTCDKRNIMVVCLFTHNCLDLTLYQHISPQLYSA